MYLMEKLKRFLFDFRMRDKNLTLIAATVMINEGFLY
jgi:hypothetical protein